jgi:hypothetical protein
MGNEYITNQCFKSAVFVNQYNNTALCLDANFPTKIKEVTQSATSFILGFD